jgi:SAM-dependent methyltransferase
VSGAGADHWSAVASDWAALWGAFADPARLTLIEAASIGPGRRVLDVGCGSGEFLELLARTGAEVAGIDPAPAMLELARRRVPDADIRHGDFGELPWPAASFDVVTAINSLQFADDKAIALREVARVVRPGGRIGIANWADDEWNDIDTVEAAVSRAVGEEPSPTGDYRKPGGLEALFREADLEIDAAGIIAVPWSAPDDETLIRGVLLGEEAADDPAARTALLEAARPFVTGDGGYLLHNAFRFVVGHPTGHPGTSA